MIMKNGTCNGYFEDKHPLDTWEQIKDNFMRYSYNELECSLLLTNL